MIEVKKSIEGGSDHVKDLTPFQEALESTNVEVNQLIEEIKHMRNGGAADTSIEDVRNIKKRIFAFPEQTKEKIVSLERDDIEKLKIVLKKTGTVLGGGIKASLIANNIEYLKLEVQEWLGLIREGIIIVDNKSPNTDAKELSMLAELSANLRQASFPGTIEVWLQRHIWKELGRNSATKKVKEMYNVRMHAERMVEKYRKENL